MNFNLWKQEKLIYCRLALADKKETEVAGFSQIIFAQTKTQKKNLSAPLLLWGYVFAF